MLKCVKSFHYSWYSTYQQIESKTNAEKCSKTQNDKIDPEFFIHNTSTEYVCTENKNRPPFDIAILYQRIISNLNFETVFRKEQPVTRDKYFQEEINFFYKINWRILFRLIRKISRCANRLKPTFHHILPNKIIRQKEKQINKKVI